MNKSDVINAMELSALAYRNVQPQLACETLTVIDDAESGVQCYVRRNGGTLSITFRGTNSGQDWKTDFTFWKKTIPYDNTVSKIRVHTGFINAYKSLGVRDRLHSLVTRDVQSIHISGHSYGAALAVLCAVDLEYNHPEKDIEVLLFGCPRVGNSAFRKSYNKRVFKTLRIENGNDIVTKIPFASWGYRHVGIRLHVGPPRIFGLLSGNQHQPQNYHSSIFTQLPS